MCAAGSYWDGGTKNCKTCGPNTTSQPGTPTVSPTTPYNSPCRELLCTRTLCALLHPAGLARLPGLSPLT